MQEAIAKAHTLIEALGYIQRFLDKIVVVKMGGSIMDDEQALADMLTDVVFMNTVGMRPVMVHGGGKAISNAMEQRGLEVQFVQGRRYTDQRTLTVVEHVLCNEINRQLDNARSRPWAPAPWACTRCPAACCSARSCSWKRKAARSTWASSGGSPASTPSCWSCSARPTRSR